MEAAEKKCIMMEDSHLHSFVQVSTLKARLKVKSELCAIGITGGLFNRPFAPSGTCAGEIRKPVGFQVEGQRNNSALITILKQNVNFFCVYCAN